MKTDYIPQIEGEESPSIELIMETLSEKYGWTPEEIKKQNHLDIVAYIKIGNDKAIRAKRQK
jgi:hypothetical protein